MMQRDSNDIDLYARMTAMSLGNTNRRTAMSLGNTNRRIVMSLGNTNRRIVMSLGNTNRRRVMSVYNTSRRTVVIRERGKQGVARLCVHRASHLNNHRGLPH